MRPSVLERLDAALRRGEFLVACATAPSRSELKESSVLARWSEVLLFLGRRSEAREGIEALLAMKSADVWATSKAWELSSIIKAEEGDYKGAQADLRQSVRVARTLHDEEQLCRSQLRMAHCVSISQGPRDAEGILESALQLAVRLGNSQILAWYHVRMGEIEGRRGHFATSASHFEAASRLEQSDQSLWLRGHVSLDLSAMAFLAGDFIEARVHAAVALELASKSGHRRTELAARTNYGRCQVALGLGSVAETTLVEVLSYPALDFAITVTATEGLAQLCLNRGDVRGAEARLESLGVADASRSWYDLAAYPTRIALALRQRKPAAALRLVGEATASAESRSDALLGTQLLLLRAESLLALGRLDEAGEALSETLHKSADMPLNTLGELERVQGKYLAAQHAPAAAVEHLDRAIRVFLTTGHVAARLDTMATRNEIVATLPTTAANPPGGPPALPALDAGWASHLVEMAAHSELLGREAFALLERSRGMHWAILSANSGVNQDILLSAGIPPRSVLSPQRHTVRLMVGRSRDREIVLTFEPRQTFAAEQVVWSVRRLIDTAMSVEAAKRSQRERASLWPKVASHASHSPFASDSMREILRAAEQLADTNIPILITGETGTGKEVLAREIHTLSRRGSQPFMPFNCTAVARDMLDSQLFGHRRGAFTGASDHFLGVIRTATGGTLFLDEIGEIGLDVQPKLLRFLESSEVHPLGEGFPQRVDVRVIAATNADVDGMVAEGRFREDLFYRLTPARFRIPPLRERRDEIPALLRYFVAKFSDEYQKQEITLTDEALEFLLLFRWPGNIRQLMHEVRRLVALTPAGHTIEAHMLSSDIRSARPIPVTTPPVTPNRLECVIRLDQPLPKATAQLETLLISNALSDSGGVVEKAAKRLGISRKGLFLKRRRLKL